MRADSPGHSEKYSNKVDGSYHMEKEGLTRSLALLESRGVKLDCIVTDRYPQVQKFLRERNITYYYDVWHMAKGISKKLEAISKQKDSTPAFYKLEKLLTNKRMMKDVAKLSPHYQTSSLEAFHAIILRFAPKNVVFPFIGMLCRLYLAAMHYNENGDRPQAKTQEGYVADMMDLIFEEVFVNPTPYTAALLAIPVPEDLSAQYE
ncbi:hypothetical protein PFLUV_G00119630 [Perca fluviatilis]|uniref:Uncharacterized protein n=1 Tax=Perca fluviatilis TaxID=8168 RepID=A0A6A5F106_PERFL|nr:hypothetical protein PFLUV_G00119630 [Perca fluviatilis]